MRRIFSADDAKQVRPSGPPAATFSGAASGEAGLPNPYPLMMLLDELRRGEREVRE